MTKKEFIRRFSEKINVSQKEGAIATDSFLSTVTEALVEEGNVINFVNWGSIKLVHRKAREGRNPQTGDPINIDASNKAKLKEGKDLTEAIKKVKVSPEKEDKKIAVEKPTKKVSKTADKTVDKTDKKATDKKVKK